MKPGFLFFILLLFTFSEASGEDRIVFGCNFFPPLKVNNSSDYPGHDVEILRAIFKDNVSTPFMPWRRALNEAREGKIEGLCSCSKNEHRQKQFYYSDQIGEVEVVVYHLPKSPSQRKEGFRDFDSAFFLDKKVGVVRGYNLQQELEEMGIGPQVSSNELQLLRMLVSGRIDAIYGFRGPLQHYLRQNFSKTLGGSFLSVRKSPYYFCVSKKAPQGPNILKALNQGIEKLEKRGFRSVLKEKYNL